MIQIILKLHELHGDKKNIRILKGIAHTVPFWICIVFVLIAVSILNKRQKYLGWNMSSNEFNARFIQRLIILTINWVLSKACFFVWPRWTFGKNQTIRVSISWLLYYFQYLYELFWKSHTILLNPQVHFSPRSSR